MKELSNCDLWWAIWKRSDMRRAPLDHGVWYNQYDFVVDSEPTYIKIHKITYPHISEGYGASRLEYHWPGVLNAAMFCWANGNRTMDWSLATKCDEQWLEHALVILRLTLEPV